MNARCGWSPVIRCNINEMVEIHEHQRVVLKEDLPTLGLAAGDVGTVVHVYDGGKGFEVEFFTLTGETIAVQTLAKAQVRSVGPRDVSHARSRDDAA